MLRAVTAGASVTKMDLSGTNIKYMESLNRVGNCVQQVRFDVCCARALVQYGGRNRWLSVQVVMRLC